MDQQFAPFSSDYLFVRPFSTREPIYTCGPRVHSDRKFAELALYGSGGVCDVKDTLSDVTSSLRDLELILFRLFFLVV